MRTGIRPRVNEAREFLEIAKDFRDPKEIIREALSNSWDAGATHASLKFSLTSVPGSRRKKITVEIADNGEGMSAARRAGLETSEIEDFFNLGDSNKPQGSIGTKGHGTKIYYKSEGIIVDTWKEGRHLHAETEVPPWETLKNGVVPTYKYEEDDKEGHGTRIVVKSFEARQKDFWSPEGLIEYILWYTVVGSFGQYCNKDMRRMDVKIKPLNLPAPVTIEFGFNFPDEQLDVSKGTEIYCKKFGPTMIPCETTEDGVEVKVDVIGALMGEGHRDIVPDTYGMMGLWLCKDFIRVERNNDVIEDVFGGQYYYRSMLIMANSQQFDLTANRNNIRSDQEEYDLAVSGIKGFIEHIRDDDGTSTYFDSKKKEDEHKDEERRKRENEERRERLKSGLEERLAEYKGRPDLHAPGVHGAPLKEPRSEAETALLLQAMISSNHPGIDFTIGEYKTSWGTDLLVEYESKGIPSFAWVEIVSTLEKLFLWSHPPDGIHKVVCWELGNVGEHTQFKDGRTGKFTKRVAGRYNLEIAEDILDVYVLREILSASKQ